MTWITETWRRLRSLGRRADVERGLDDELVFHVEQQTAKNTRAGMAPDEARRQAFIKFGGGTEHAKELTRDEFRASRLEDLTRDVRYAFRTLGRAPGFTIVAILTLAIGIGATTAVFSVVNGVLIKPLPYPDSDRLVDLVHAAPGANIPGGTLDVVSATQFFTYRDENRTFEEIGLWSWGDQTVTGQADPERVQGLFVTHTTLPMLGVAPAVGRWFSAEDDAPGSPETVMLAHRYWQRRHGSDAALIGRTITVDGQPRQVIGVMSEEFLFPTDLILPYRFNRSALVMGQFSYKGVGRLRPGVTLAEANEDVARMIPIWLRAWPSPPGVDPAVFENAGFTPALRPLKQLVVGDVSKVLWVLMGTIGIVLVIACANVANLLLVRTDGRQQELIIRSALGAGRWRIARVLLIESLTLSVVGGATGLVLAFVGVRILVAAGPATLPRLGDISVDPVVLVFALTISLASGLTFGAIPALRRTRPDLAGELRGSGRTSSDSRERRRARNTLVVVQVSMAAVLLVASGLMIRSFVALRHVEPGFADADRIQLLSMAIPAADVSDPEQVFRVQMDMRDRIAAAPGVSLVSMASTAPMQFSDSHDVIQIENRSVQEGQFPPVRRFKFVAPGYFQTLGTPLVAGRELDWADIHARRRVVVISENFARETWDEPTAALGKRIRENEQSPWREVIGVATDVYEDGLYAAPATTVYWPLLMENFQQRPVQISRGITFVVRSERAGTESLLADIREAVRAVNGNLPLAQVRTLGELYERSLAPTSFTLVMLAIAGTMALLLAIVGVYGVLSYTVAQRTREIGIRAALGASQQGLRTMFVRDGVILAIVGVSAGLVAAGALTRTMTSLLFGVDALDPITYVAVAVVLTVAAGLAAYIPARRATAVDPVEVLRGS